MRKSGSTIAAVAVLLLLVGSGGVMVAQDREATTPVVLLTIESTRADHLPCYGYDRNTTPFLCDEFAGDAVTFERAYSAGTNTHVSVPVLLTGRSAAAVGLDGWDQALPGTATTLPEMVQAEGYATRANLHAGYGSGLQQGIDEFYRPEKVAFIDWNNLPSGIYGDVPVDRDPTAAVRDGTFLWHFFRDLGHDPYTPPDRFRQWDRIDLPTDRLNNRTIAMAQNDTWHDWIRRNPEKAAGLYDAELRAVDARIKAMMKTLNDRGVYEEALIIVTADHGESLGEDGVVTHANRPRDREVHVPLFVKFPGNRFGGERVDTQVRHIDIVPTVLDIVGVTVPIDMPGRSLVPLARGGGESRPAVSAGGISGTWAVRDRNRTYLLENVNETCLGGAEPVETVEPAKAVATDLRSHLCSSYREGIADREIVAANHSAAMRERLRDLGYLG